MHCGAFLDSYIALSSPTLQQREKEADSLLHVVCVDPLIRGMHPGYLRSIHLGGGETVYVLTQILVSVKFRSITNAIIATETREYYCPIKSTIQTN